MLFRSIQLQILDGGNGAGGLNNEPKVLEEWQILGAYLKDVNYNSMDYNTSDAVKVGLTITFDNAIQVNGAGVPTGVGEAIAYTVGTVATGVATSGTRVA